MKLAFFKKAPVETTEWSKANERLLKTYLYLEETRLSLVKSRGYEDIEAALKALPPKTVTAQYWQEEFCKRNKIKGIGRSIPQSGKGGAA
jgi:hypothetical protein